MPEREEADIARDLAASGFLEESAEDLYENAPCGYFSTTPDGTIVKVNGTFLDWTGYEREQIVGVRRIAELLAPGDRIFYETHYAPLLEMQGAVREIAVDVLRADGTRLPALVNAVLRRDQDGRPKLVRTTVFNATERREYERELVRAREVAESRSRAAHALAHVAEGVMLVNEAGCVELLNAAALAILEIDESVYGEPVATAIPGWASIAEGIPVGEPERWPTAVALPLLRGGDELWISLAGVDSGEGIVYTLRDVTAERRLDHIRDDIVTIASHEFRTPLAGAYGAAKTLLELGDVLDADSRHELLLMIVAQAERLTKIVDDFLVTSRLDHGDVRISESAFDAAIVAERAAALVGRTRQAETRLQLDLGAGVMAHGDPAHTEQVLAGIIDNAVLYSPPTTPVRVTVDAHRGHARFTVADEGPGIPPAERTRVFEKFHRLDPEQRHGVGGTGLGLYIARELVERMKGRIAIEPGDIGTVVVVELPLDRPSV